jgi:hypothetical protein
VKFGPQVYRVYAKIAGNGQGKDTFITVLKKMESFKQAAPQQITQQVTQQFTQVTQQVTQQVTSQPGQAASGI